MKNRFCSFLALLLLISALPAPARITFTITATADHTPGNAAQSYLAGHTYTFVYALTQVYPQNHNYFPGGNNDWFEKDITAEVPLFTAVGGTGLRGAFVDPAGPAGSPFSFVRAYNGNFLGLYAGADAGDIGLTTLGGTTLTHVIASANVAGLNFAMASHYTNPADYFAGYVGDYQAWGGSVGLYGGAFDGATFQVTGVSISNVSAIPEPSTYAVLLGLGALGLVVWRRQRRKLKLES